METEERILCFSCWGRGHGDGDMMFFACQRCNGTGYEQDEKQELNTESIRHCIQAQHGTDTYVLARQELNALLSRIDALEKHRPGLGEIINRLVRRR